VLDSTGEKLLDEKARNFYRKELADLQQEIEAAELTNDLTTLESLQLQYDQLTEHLSQSLGLKGKSRQTGSSVEKARSAVTWRIRNAIAKIEIVHPTLGKHLSNTIKTGTVCKYSPEKNIQWITS
jgi:flagellar motility protein MotE (MotC chaperone)